MIIGFLSYSNVFASYIDTLCNDTAELNRIIEKLEPKIVSYVNLYCFKKAIELRCNIPPGFEPFGGLVGRDYSYRMYEKRGIVFSCNDTLNFAEREVDPNSRRGSEDVCAFFDWASTYLTLDDKLMRKNEEILVYPEIYGKKTIQKFTSCGGFFEILETEHDSIGSLIFSRREIRKYGETLSSRIEVWNKGKLVRTKYNDVNRSIVEKTPCYLKVLEPNETIIIQLDPEKERPVLTQKVAVDSNEVYEVIKYHWYPHCKKYHETKKLVEADLNQEKELNVSIKNEDDSPSHASPYKYYAIISVCIAVASVAIIRKRRRTRK